MRSLYDSRSRLSRLRRPALACAGTALALAAIGLLLAC